MNLFTEKQWRQKYREQTYAHGWRKERVGYGESSMEA